MRCAIRIWLLFGLHCAISTGTLCSTVWAQDDATPWPRASNPLRISNLPNDSGVVMSTQVDELFASEIEKLKADLSSANFGQAIVAMHQLPSFGPEGTRALVSVLTDSQLSMELRSAAAGAVEELGAAAVLPLVGSLQATPGSDTMFVWRTLNRLGPQSRTAVPALLSLLDQLPSDDDRISVVNVLGAIGPGARIAVDRLIRFIDDDSAEELQLVAIEAIRDIGFTSEQSARLVGLMLKEEKSVAVRLGLADVLASQPSPPPVILPVLIGFLQDSEEWTQCERAARAIAKLGEDGGDAVPALTKLLSHEGQDVRVAAADALGAIGSEARASLDQLVDLVESDATDDVIAAGAKAISELGGDGVDRLLRGLTDVDTQENSLAALSHLGPRAAAAVPQLLKMLADPTYVEGQVAIVHVLGEIGGQATDAIPALAAILGSEPQPVELRVAAAKALGQISLTAQPALLAAMQSDEPEVRIAAARAINYQCRDRKLLHRAVMPVLVHELLEGTAANSALAAIAEMDATALEALRPVVLDANADNDVRRDVCSLIAHSGPEGMRFLLHVIRDGNDEIALPAEQAMKDLLHDRAVPVLIDEINSLDAMPATQTNDGYREVLLRLLVEMHQWRGGAGGGSSVADLIGASPSAQSIGSGPSAAPSYGSGGGGTANGGRVGASPVLPAPTPVAPNVSIQARAGAPESDSAAGSQPSTTREMDERIVTVFYGTNRVAVGISGAVKTLWSYIPAVLAALVTTLACWLGWKRWRRLNVGLAATVGTIATLLLLYSANTFSSRNLSGTALRPGPVYGPESQKGLEVGVCEVSIPEDHDPGELESPSILRLEFSEDPQKHIVLQYVTEYSQTEFQKRLSKTLAERENSILVFVHGYNVGFDDAARRTAQLAVDLKFRGVPVFFSWPSQGDWYQYRRDEKLVELAVPVLKQFLTEVVAQSGAKSIHLIAHSMGNRALTSALKEIQADAEARDTRFQQVVLAAPDIDADIFRDRIAPAVIQQAERVTLYASSNDFALLASRTFNSGDSRAGDTSRGLVLIPGIETIDVSAVDTSLLGHSYYGDNPTVITDLRELLTSLHSADERPFLQPMALEQFRYWVFQHPAMALGTAIKRR